MMKKFLLAALAVSAHAVNGQNIQLVELPDSMKAIQLYAEIKIGSEPLKEGSAGIQTDVVKLGIERDKKERSFEFEFPKTAKVITSGIGVEQDENELEWSYPWSVGETYRFLISIATDSAGNFSLYSGYIGLPKEDKWKLIGTCRIEGRWSTLTSPASFHSTGKELMSVTNKIWIQRNNGSWKAVLHDLPAPSVNVASHLDSALTEKSEITVIEAAIKEGKTDASLNTGGVYYTILKEGTGRQLSLDDTVVVHYKGYLFSTGEVFDQTKESPATFPLKRLIRGWQIGMPMAKVGGKIKLVIPSHLAYSIRTRAARIPPNSILVFEIEIIDARR